ncbi:SDR family oxidoreductase [bacterium]|nr:MAG: SDR family oxidoreductase [bacterium]
MSLAGKVALVTGAGSGIGKGAALAFARAGARVAFLDMKEETAAAAIKEAEGQGHIPVAADVSDGKAMKAAIDRVAKETGRLDIVFANAGINGVWAPIEEIKDEEFDRTIAINLRGTFLTIKYAVPYLAQQGGAVLVTSSVNGTRIFSNTGATAYSTSKAGQVAMAKMLAVELGQKNIRVNVICPGAIETNIDQNTEQRNTESIKIPVEYPEGNTPLPGEDSGSIEQVGRLALFLASNWADHINGEVVYIDAGASLVTG